MKRPYQKRILKLIPFEEALQKVTNSLNHKKLDYECIKVEEALWRVSAENMVVKEDVPPFNKAAVDGFAVRAEDIKEASQENPITLKVVGKLFPSSNPSTLSIEGGQAVYVATGSPIPINANVVIRVENVRVIKNDLIEIREPVNEWKNVSKVGEDLKKGEVILEKGDVITARDIGLLTLLKVKNIKVFRKVRVAIISVGDELTELYNEKEGKIVNSHAHMFYQLLLEIGVEPKMIGVVKDNLESIVKKMRKAVKESDMVITIGGCSVGIKDYVPDAIRTLGGKDLIFHGIKITPGKVSGIGIVHNKPIIMLPGYATSGLACFYLFVVPILNYLSGFKATSNLPVVNAKLTKDANAKQGLNLLLFLKLRRVKDEYEAEPLTGPLSSLNHLAKANAYTIVRAGRKVKSGEFVKAYMMSFKEFMPLRG
jgi:molybdopterin molybdotransferase